MIQKDYTKELENILQTLRNKDFDNCTILRQILYDWSIHLTLCLGAIQIITKADTSFSIDSNELSILKETEGRLEDVIGSMRKALINDSYKS